MKLPLSKIDLPVQMLNDFDPQIVYDLKVSMSGKFGQMQPIIVRPILDRYRIIFGKHRYYAAKGLGWTEIEAVIRDVSEEDALFMVLQENLLRHNMNPVLEGEIYSNLLKKGHTVKGIAIGISKSTYYVNYRLDIYNKLAQELKPEVGKTLTLVNAVRLSRHPKKKQLEIFGVIKENLNKAANNGKSFGGGNLWIADPSLCRCPKCGGLHRKGVSENGD